MSRKYSIDLLRVMSAIAVIIIHAVTAPVANSASAVAPSLHNTLNTLHNLMRWAIPVFFMISGYCLFSKQECTYKYCFSHVLKYVAVLCTIGLFYAALEEIFVAKSISLALIYHSILNVISGHSWAHMWFVYTIIGIYLVIPVIHSFMQKDDTNIYIFTGLLFLFNILLPAINSSGLLSIIVDFPFCGYLFYVCFGGLVAKCKVGKFCYYLFPILGLISVIYIMHFSHNKTFEYNSLSICLLAISIFLIINNMGSKQNVFISKIATCTWGIYLIHPLFINIFLKILKMDLLSSMPYIKLPLFCISIFLLSYIFVYLFKKIPLIKELF